MYMGLMVYIWCFLMQSLVDAGVRKHMGANIHLFHIRPSCL